MLPIEGSKVRLMRLIVVAAVSASALGVTAPARALAPRCDYPVSIFTRVGVFSPATVVAPGYHPGAVGCNAAGAGLEADTFYVLPGSTVARARLLRAVDAAPAGCVTSPDGGLLDSDVCDPWTLERAMMPGSRFAESPYVPLDPTRTVGTLQAEAEGHGASNVYRTLAP
ncbi:MAG TPA: hypothetical protein VM840_07280 [Actinomycetota bacterium]|nr:hypothetical protein [Actinomycetota bacterium]